jgi:hypothetical protein
MRFGFDFTFFILNEIQIVGREDVEIWRQLPDKNGEEKAPNEVQF